MLLVLGPTQGGAQDRRTAHVLEIEGAVGPATSDYLSRAFDAAAQDGASLLILRMDTPGGLDTSMREIIRHILASPVPVATYVAPSGARAASAGAFIVYASHVAVMAPGTNVGAATPVQIGGGGGAQPGGGSADGNEAANGAAPQGPTGSERKAVNDAVAYIRSLAELRGRNVEWAEEAVRSGASLSATAAVERNVADFIARDMDELLSGLNGRTVTAAGRQVTIETEGMRLIEAKPNWRTRILSAITNPNVALILMLIGVYGLIFEFMNPGALYPGAIGAISLLLALYALAALPVNFAGIGLLLLGLALIAGEAFSPSFGVLGIAGAVAVALGATIMFDTDIPEFRISWAAAAGFGLASLAVVLVLARVGLSSRNARIVSGREQMVGATGEVIEWSGGRGHVWVHGERWRARGVDELAAGDAVEVREIDGLTLTVAPATAAEGSDFKANN
ncbi:nodulation protein NfeD [Sphingomonas sp.]|uniref:NfeD family protein n=1 Tax=Sphingomonas sp. TaxID=28214 RepID=UPI0025E9754B|nr:nodulation protein NfeD [Sphingomonas sp.]